MGIIFSGEGGSLRLPLREVDEEEFHSSAIPIPGWSYKDLTTLITEKFVRRAQVVPREGNRRQKCITWQAYYSRKTPAFTLYVPGQSCRQRVYVRRVMFEVFNAQLQKGQKVYQMCRTPGCIYPLHLMQLSGETMNIYLHSHMRRGEKNVHAKISDADIVRLRRCAAEERKNTGGKPTRTVDEFQEELGVTRTHLWNVIHRKRRARFMEG